MSTIAVETARAWITAANDQNKDRLKQLSQDDIEIVGPRGTVQGSEILLEWLDRAGLTLESKRYFSEGNTVVVEHYGTWRSVETGEVMGQSEVASRFVIKNGRVSVYERFDSLNKALDSANLSMKDEKQVA